MKLAKPPESISELRRNTRYLLEKMRDLYRPKKYENIINKSAIAPQLNMLSDVQVCISYLINSYNCYLLAQSSDFDYPLKKYGIFLRHLEVLNDQISSAVQNGKIVPKKYISNVLKVQTVFFRSLKSKKTSLDCKHFYEKMVLSAVVVWNNDWSGKVIE